MSPEQEIPTPYELTALFVAIGRIEEKLSNMSERETSTSGRLDKIDGRLSQLELNIAANVRPKTQWWVIAGGLAGIASVITFIVFILNMLYQITTAIDGG